MKKENLWTKICTNCPLCKYVRTHKIKGIKYNLYRIIEFFCPACRLANLSQKQKIKVKNRENEGQRN